MNYDMVKYNRGQVWMIRNKSSVTPVGHEQNKDRPWLILSVAKFNKSSGMLTAVPLSTRDNVVSPAQVKFINDRGVSNVIMCEQIKSFDHSCGAYIFEYMGTLSDDILEKVDVALSVHLGLHYSPITLDKLYDSMESIIKSVGHMQEKLKTPKFTDDDVLSFVEKLQSLVPSAEDEVCSTEETPSNIMTGTSMMKPYYVTPVESGESTSLQRTGRVYDIPADPPAPQKRAYRKSGAPRMNWTKEKCEEFIEDTETMPMLKVMDKWNISQKARFYSTKSYVANLLMKMTQS